MGEGCEDPGGDAQIGAHAPSYYGDQRQIGFQIDGIWMDCPVDAGDDGLLPFLEFALMDVYGHGIDPRGQMLKGDIVFFKDLQDLSPESDL